MGQNKKRNVMENKMWNLIFKKSIPFLIILDLIFGPSATAVPPTQDKQKPSASTLVSIDFQDAALKDVLKILSRQSGLNLIATEKVKGKRITLYLDEVTVQDALDSIVSANGLTYEQAPGSDIFIVKEPSPGLLETVTRIFRLNYAPVYSDIEKSEEKSAEEEGDEETSETDIVILIKEMLSKKIIQHEMGKTTTQYLGSVVTDARTNSIIVTDTPAKLKIIEEIIAKLDVPVPQVMIEVQVIETSLNTLENLGLEWGTDGEIFSIIPAASDLIFPFHHIYKDSLLGWPANSAASDGRVVDEYKGIYPGRLGTDSLKVTLDLLVTEKKVKILARPKILTLSNVTAQININSNDAIQYEENWLERGDQWEKTYVPQRVEKDERPGVTLIVTPIVNQDNVIKMIIEPKVITKVTSDMWTVDSPVYDLHFRTAKTTVMVNDGETIIIGGLISRVEEHTLKKVPFLGDIPILGKLFRHSDVNDEDTEIVFFITPHIVHREMLVSESFPEQSDLSQLALEGDSPLQLLSESSKIEKEEDVELKNLTGKIKKELEIQRAIEKYSVE